MRAAGGLSAIYFPNSFYLGDALAQTIVTTPSVNFSADAPMAPTSGAAAFLRFSGLIRPALTSAFTLVANVSGGGVTLRVNGVTIAGGGGATGWVAGTFSATGNSFFDVGVDFARTGTSGGGVSLLWGAGAQPLALISSARLFYPSARLGGSPFSTTVMPRTTPPPPPRASSRARAPR
jgi:hypothetical protein